MFSLNLPKLLASRIMRPLALLAIAALAAPGAAMAASNWTSVGSTGIVDEICHFSVLLNNQEARLVPGIVGTCKLRYQVIDTFPVPPANLRIRARIAATSPGERVEVRLFSYDLTLGNAPVQLLFLNSATATTIGGVDLLGFRTYVSGCFASAPTFATKSYYIEADLIRFPSLSLTLNPALASLTVGPC